MTNLKHNTIHILTKENVNKMNLTHIEELRYRPSNSSQNILKTE